MPESLPRRSSFRQHDYEKTAEGMASLFARLPERDVRAVAEEALKRIGAQADAGESTVARGPSPEDIERLCLALMSDDAAAGASIIDALVEQGTTHEDICLHYLAPAARNFGTRWDQDRASFFEVTIGAGRIFAILRALNGAAPVVELPTSRSALFAAVPGETHLLGIRMAADLFRHRGWDIELVLDKSHEALMEHVAQSGQRLIGLSAAGKHSAPALARLIVALRVQNPTCFVLVSGQIVSEASELVDATMPDGMANDLDAAEAFLMEASATE